MSICKVLFLISFILVSGAVYQKTKTRLVKISCDPNPEYVNNMTCEIKAIRRYLQYFQINMTFYRPVPTLWMRVKNYRKTSANRYMPGVFDIKQDICEFSNGNAAQQAFFQNFLRTIFKERAEILLQQFRKCPYQGRFYVDAFINQTIGPSPRLIEPGEYKTEVTLYSPQNVTYAGWCIYLLLNNAD